MRYSLLLRAISVLLINAFLVSGVAFAAPESNLSTLAALSKFNPDEEEALSSPEDINASRGEVNPGENTRFYNTTAANVVSELIRDKLEHRKKTLVVAIDGDSCVGKTELSKHVKLPARSHIMHIDHEHIVVDREDLSASYLTYFDEFSNMGDLSPDMEYWDYRKAAEDLKRFVESGEFDVIILEGLDVLILQVLGYLEFDIKIHLIADHSTRERIYRDKFPGDPSLERMQDYLSRYRQRYSTESVDYDIVIENKPSPDDFPELMQQALETRLKLRHKLDFKSLTMVIYVVRRLKKFLTANILRESHIARLNKLLSKTDIGIYPEIKKGKIGCTGKPYKYAVFHFKKIGKIINVLFFEDHTNLTPTELEELGIKDEEKHYLDCQGLEGVWFTEVSDRYFIGEFETLDDARRALLSSKRVTIYADVRREPSVMDLKKLVKSDIYELGLARKKDGTWLLIKGTEFAFSWPWPVLGLENRMHSHPTRFLWQNKAEIDCQWWPSPEEEGCAETEYIISVKGLCAYGGNLEKPILATWRELSSVNLPIRELHTYFENKASGMVDTTSQQAAPSSPSVSQEPEGYIDPVFVSESALRGIAKKAGEMAIRIRKEGKMDIALKADKSIATKADRELEVFLDSALTNLIPGSIVIGEESFEKDKDILRKAKDAQYVWVVDPIDGTNEYAGSDSGYCIAISLLKNGQPIYALVYAPEHDIDGSGSSLFEASVNREGAYLNGRRIFTENKTSSLSEAKVDMHDSSHVPVPPYYELIKERAKERANNKGISAMMKVLRIAENSTYPDREELFIKPTPCIWDIVQAAFIVQKAGGVVSYDNGEAVFPMNLNLIETETTGLPRLPTVIVGSPAVQEECIELVRQQLKMLDDARKARRENIIEFIKENPMLTNGPELEPTIAHAESPQDLRVTLMGEYKEKCIKYLLQYFSRTNTVKIEFNKDIKEYSTLRIGAEALAFVEPTSIEELRNILTFTHQNNIPVNILGRGSDTFFGEYVPAIVISMKKINGVKVEGELVKVGAGIGLPNLANKVKEHGLSGLEFASVIPGTAGGAVVMNAGFRADSIDRRLKELGIDNVNFATENIIEEVKVITLNGELKTLTNDEIEFGTKHSIFQSEPMLIYEVTFRLKKRDKEDIAKIMEIINDGRLLDSKMWTSSLGAIFRPQDESYVFEGEARTANWFVEQIGVKGWTEGDIAIHESDPTVLYNQGRGTQEEYITLAARIYHAVYERFGVKLIVEVKSFPAGMLEKKIAENNATDGTNSRAAGAKNKYYLISGSTAGIGSTLGPLYDNLPRSIRDKVITHVVSSTPTFKAQYNVPPELEQHILDYFREHIQKAKDADAVPILIGGLHVLSYWFYIALGEVYGIEADIVSLDMDSDTMSYRLDDCGFWNYGIKKGTMDPKKITVVGIEVPPHEPGQWAAAQGVTFSAHDLPEGRTYENVFVSLDTDLYIIAKETRVSSEKLKEIATRLSAGNILGLHIANMESEYMFGLRDSELNFLEGLFPGIMSEEFTAMPVLIDRVKDAVRSFNLKRCISNASMVIYLLRALGEKAELVGMYNIAEDMPFQYLVRTEKWGEIDIKPSGNEGGEYEETRESPEADYKKGLEYLRKHGYLAQADQMLIDGYFRFPDGERIHTENRNHPPDIPNETILCLVVADSILPYRQKDILNRLESEMRNGADYSYKIVSLSVNNPYDTKEFMRKLETIRLREEERYREKGYKVQFDVACPSKELVGMVQDKYKNDMQALAFTKEGDGDIIQVESIILALHVLRTGKIDDLLRVYKLLTGKEFKTDKPVESIRELAKSMLFELPVISILDINERNRLNALIEENIKQAA